MPRIQLQVYLDPSSVEVFINLRQPDGNYVRVAATVDTGAAVSLLPANLLNKLDYRLGEHGVVTIEQAGIARQSFAATEAIVKLRLEDHIGTQTDEFEARIWFAETDIVLIGFDGILDRSILYIDMQDTRSGWIEIST
jgi:hypothetical protein